MQKIQKECTYESSSEKELIKMWEDIKDRKIENLYPNLLKDIDKNTEFKIGEDKIPLYTREMWDSEEGKWVPFDLRGAHYIVNTRKEYVVLRMFRPVNIQPQYGDVLSGFQSLDSSYLNEQLKEKNMPAEDNSPFKSFSGMQNFYEMVRQDRI
jgi:hypothetical protein